MNLTRLKWPKGWTPSADPVNGDPEGLIRMDNLQQDEQGVLSLTRGFRQLNAGGFSDYVSDIYSKNFGSKECLWAALNVDGRSIIRSKNGDFTDATVIASGNASAVFGDALGEVLICAGTTRVKDDGNNVKKLGLEVAGKPVPGAVSQPSVGISGSFVVIEGTDGKVDETTLRAVIIAPLGQDLLNIGANAAGTDPSNDVFKFIFTPKDGNLVSSVQVDFLLDAADSSAQNYYSFTWTSEDVVPGVDAATALTASRGQFTRLGTDTKFDWTTVAAIRVSINAISFIEYTFDSMSVVGGSQGALNGQYTYKQVSVYDNNYYVAKSPASEASDAVTVLKGNVTIQTGSSDSQANKVWIYRISVTSNNPGQEQKTFLNQYYKVGEVDAGGSFKDNVSDDEALLINDPLNPYLISVQPLGDSNGLNDTIFGIEGLFNGRMLYMGLSSIYFSDSLDPDTIDSRYTIKAFGDPSEKNLWIKKLSNNVLILGTTKNLYEITGDLSTLPDGTLNLAIIPIGEAYPPLGAYTAVVNGGIFYPASDGIRVTRGSNSTLISPQLRLLFQGETRSKVPSIAIVPNNNARYSLAIGKTKLYVTVPMNDGSRRLLIFDMIEQTWRLVYSDPLIVHVTPTDRVLLGYNISSSSSISVGSIFEYENGDGVQDSSGSLLEGLNMHLETVLDHNNQPRNRKDTFTLKLIVDTGGNDVSVYLSVGKVADEISWQFLKDINTSGVTTVYIPLNLSGITLNFRYGLRLNDKNLLTKFKLYEYTIEYDARPEQVNYLRIPNNNLGNPSRKRILSYPFVIDTLGGDVTFTPHVDGVAGSPTTVNTPVKLTYAHYFTSEVLGVDVGGILESPAHAPFEFYGVNPEDSISEKLPAQAKFLVIPANDYGNPNRKRHTSYKFQINTRGKNVRFTPIIDGVSFAPLTVNTANKRTVEYFFTQATSIAFGDGDVTGIDIGGTLQSLENTPFEFYGVIFPQHLQVLPDRVQYLVIPPNDYGTPSRKRHSSYKFQLNTNSHPVKFTPIVDGIGYDPVTYNTTQQQMCEYYFLFDVKGIEVGGILEALTDNAFEFYEVIVPQQVETFPPLLEYFVIPANDYGTPDRKRHTSYKFQINTNGLNVRFTPVVDGVSQTPIVFSNLSKTTVEYFFNHDVIGIDIGGVLEALNSQPFEFYGVVIPQQVEKLPPRLKYFVIPANDYGKPNRKRHTSYKFQINTKGKNVKFTPILDGVSYTPTVYNTASRKTVEYFFPGAENFFAFADVIGIDIGGILESTEDTPFEFYDVVVPQEVEVLPARLTYFRIPNTNYGVAAKKRIRTLPLVIDTRGQDVTYAPIVDGVYHLPASVFNTQGKTTVFHYFVDDVFGTDFGGTLQSSGDAFEFYGMGDPAQVEVLPVGKKYDQLGPTRFDKIGKIFALRIRLIMTGSTSSMPYAIYGDDSQNNPTYGKLLYEGKFDVVPGVDEVYEIQIPKSVNTDICRIVLGPTVDSFHRFDLQIKASASGMESTSKWQTIR